jgi:hypothetical protein
MLLSYTCHVDTSKNDLLKTQKLARENASFNTQPYLSLQKRHDSGESFTVLTHSLFPYHGQIKANYCVKICLILLLEKAVIRLTVLVVEYLFFFNLQGNICQYITSFIGYQKRKFVRLFIFINSIVFLSSDNFSLISFLLHNICLLI